MYLQKKVKNRPKNARWKRFFMIHLLWKPSVYAIAKFPTKLPRNINPYQRPISNKNCKFPPPVVFPNKKYCTHVSLQLLVEWLWLQLFAILVSTVTPHRQHHDQPLPAATARPVEGGCSDNRYPHGH